MSKQDEVLQKAYGNMPKEVGYTTDLFSWMPTFRGVKYYWYKLVRKLKGRSSTGCDCGHSH